MMEKLRKRGLRGDVHTALQNTHDAIGIRIICSFPIQNLMVTEAFI